LYEQSLSVIEAQNSKTVLLEKTNDEQSQKINLLQLQIIELQKFIFSGKQEKFKLNPNSNEQQIALFENDKLSEVAVESIRHVKAHDVKQTVVRVNHPGPANPYRHIYAEKK
jgi:hypothetical protein